MLKEFAQYLVSLKDNKTYDIHGDTYSDHDLVRIKPHIDRPANLSVSGLDSIVKLVRNELDMFENLPVFIRVDDARTVSVFTTYDDMMCRDSLYTAKCDVPGFRDGFREYEQAIIELRSKFAPGPGVDYLLDLLSRMSIYDLATMQPEVPATVQSHYELLEKTASACIDCHACESRCPFGVKIAERMKKTAELFGC